LEVVKADLSFYFLRKQTEKLTDSALIIEKLKTALEDMTAVCIMEGFSKQDHMILVDNIIKELGAEFFFVQENP